MDGIERQASKCFGIETGEGPWAERNARGREKSSRIGVHRADGVVRGPARGERTRLKILEIRPLVLCRQNALERGGGAHERSPIHRRSVPPAAALATRLHVRLAARAERREHSRELRFVELSARVGVVLLEHHLQGRSVRANVNAAVARASEAGAALRVSDELVEPPQGDADNALLNQP
eukprot:31350-Pelagococcus_subviridis.AAC.1